MRHRFSVFAAVLAVLAAACAEAPSDDGSSSEPAGWQALPESPLSARYSAHAFWTGEEVLVLGGRDSSPCPPNADCVPPDEPALRDGASFDPATGSWTPIADAPIPLGTLTGTVLDGTLYVWTPGSSWEVGSRPAFLAYDAETDAWSELAVPPLPNGTYAQLLAAGDRLIAWHDSQERQILPDLSYDVASNRWTELPPDPLRPSFDRSYVWTGSELVLLGIEDVPNPGAEGPALYRAASFDPVEGVWRRLPDSEVVGWNPVWFWTGGQVVNPSIGSSDGGTIGNWGRSYPWGGVLDPASESWSTLPSVPSEPGGYTGISVGDENMVVSWEGWVLDASEGSWTRLTRPDDPADEHAATAWVGDRLFVWGGVRWDETDPTILGDGWTWLPGKPAPA